MIKSYVPEKSKVIDFRKPDGGYYVATCDMCGTEFYPKRSNAKYCSSKCTVVHHRKAKIDGTAPVKVLKKGGAIKIKKVKPIDYLKLTLKELKETAKTIEIAGEKVPKELIEAVRIKYHESIKRVG